MNWFVGCDFLEEWIGVLYVKFCNFYDEFYVDGVCKVFFGVNGNCEGVWVIDDVIFIVVVEV